MTGGNRTRDDTHNKDHSMESMYRYMNLSDDDKTLVDNLLRGHITPDEVPTIRSNTVKIFICSTFTDMIEERNTLAEEVYPKLREHCRDRYGIDFQVVDMRWGVPMEASDDHSATEMCLAELQNCQSLSIGPNFVAFIGQRYGYCPLPVAILRAEYEIIEAHIQDNKKDVELMRKCYLKDQNVHPNVYRLQTVSCITETIQRTWSDIESDLRRIVQTGAGAATEAGELSKESLRKMTASVTEHEIYEGLIDIKRQKDRDQNIILYVRDIQDLHRNLQDEKSTKFMDCSPNTSEINSDSKKYLDHLRSISIQKLSSFNYCNSVISWQKNGIDPKFHRPYLARLCKHFFKTTCALIDRNIISRKKLDSDYLYHEVVEHWAILKGRCETFVGREEILNRIGNYLNSSKLTQPLVIHGPSGCGKTSISAKTALIAKNASIVIRFLGTTPNSSSIQQLLFSICHQLAYITGKERGSIPEDTTTLKKYFIDFVQNGDFSGMIVIILDSLDQLSANSNGLQLDWLPSRHAENVKIIVSTLPNKHRVLDILRNKISDNFIEVESLPPKDCETIIKFRMDRDNRKVTYEQWKFIRKAFESCTLPLFVTLTFEEVSKWRSYDVLTSDTLMKTTECSIHKLFDRLEKKHGQLFVSRAFGYVTAARNGLSETELEDILSLDDDVLNSVFVLWLPPIRRIPPSLWSRLRLDIDNFLVERDADGTTVLSWYHQQFVNVVTKRYLSDYITVVNIHQLLGDYYMGTWNSTPKSFQYTPLQMQRLNITDKNGSAIRHVPKQPLIFNSEGAPRYNKRKLNQLPYSMLHGKMISRLKTTCLCNYEWMFYKLKATSMQELLADYSLFEDKETSLIADVLRMAGSVLTVDANALAPELIGRLLPHVEKCSNIRQLVRQCDLNAEYQCPLVPNCQIYCAPGGPLQYECEINIKTTSSIDVDLFQSPDGVLMTAKAYYNPTVQVWELTQGEPRQDLKMTIGELYPSADGRYLCVFKNNRFVLVYKSDSGELHGEIDYDYGKPTNVSTTNTLMTFISETGVGPFVIDIHNCVLLHKFTYNATTCAVSLDDSFLALSSQNSLLLFDVPLMERKCVAITRDEAKQIKFTREGLKCFVLTQTNLLKSIKFDLIRKSSKINDILSDYDMKNFKLSHSERYILVRATRCLYLVDTDVEKVKHRFQKMPAGVFVETMSTFSSMGFTPNDDMVVASRYTYIAVWETKTGTPLRLLPASVSPIMKIFTSDVLNKTVALLKNNTLQVWDMDNLDADVQHSNEVIGGKVKFVSVSSVSKQIVCVGNRHPEINVVDLNTGTTMAEIIYSKDREDEIYSVELSPFGKYCVAKGKQTAHSDEVINWKPLTYDVIYDMHTKEMLHESSNNRFVIFDKSCSFLASVQCQLFSQKDWIRNFYVVKVFHLNTYSKESKTFKIPENTEFVSKPLIFTSNQIKAFVAIYQTCTPIKDVITGIETGREFYTRLTLLNLINGGPQLKSVTVGSILRHADEHDKFIDVQIYNDNNLVLLYAKKVDYFQFDADKGLVCPPGVIKGAILYDPCTEFMLRHIQFVLNPDTDISTCLFSKNGSIVLNDRLQVFEKKTNGYLATITSEINMNAIRLALDGRYIIALEKCGKTVVVIRTSDAQTVTRLCVHGVASCLDVAEDDRTVVVGCNDGRVMILTLILDCMDPVTNLISKMVTRRHSPVKTVRLIDKDINKLTTRSSQEKIVVDPVVRQAPKFKSIYDAVRITNTGIKARSRACSIQ